jgi:hypothetical protein
MMIAGRERGGVPGAAAGPEMLITAPVVAREAAHEPPAISPEPLA